MQSVTNGNASTSRTKERELPSMPTVRTSIYDFGDDEIRRAFSFAANWAWFQQPGKTIFADRLYQEASTEDVDADLAESAMRFLDAHGFVVHINKMKWVIRKQFSSDLVDAACIAVAREKIGR